MNMKNIFRAIAFTFAFMLTFSFTAALAQPKPDEQGWEKVDANMMQAGESIPASRLVAIAYGFIFAAVTVFALSVSVRTRRVEEEMDALMRKLDAKGK
jgi:hypothetical protein